MLGENFKHKVKGFSFVEMSVVLASIAAVVVMTTAGVSLMKRGKLQNIISDISSFSNSISEFKQTYDALPGDISNVSSLSGANAGNGDGTINSTDEALDVWQHLSIAGLIEGSFDGNSTNLPGIGVPPADIEGGGYKITPAASTGFNTDADATNDLPEQALIIELAGFSSSSNSLPILTSEDAKTIDERADDGNPLTGTILAEGLNNDCVTAGGEYNLSEKTASCRVLFLIRSGKASNVAPEVSGSCAELGQTRQVGDVNQTCPTGYVGKIIETCRIGSDNQGVWEITDRLCTEVKCGKDGMFGDIRKLSCINKMKGTEGIVEQCTENGVWKVLRSDCNIVTSTPCPTNGDVRPHAQACDWGEQGYMIQTCTNNKWGTPTTDTCSAILCDSDNIGDVQDSASTCGSADYNGTVKEVCTGAGTWQKTSIGSTCTPDYSGSCTFGVSADKDIGCPPGKTGTHILTCINADTDYWTTLTDTCRPIKCDGDINIGNVRVKEGAFCPDNKNGTVMEYCDETGAWVALTNNCVTGVCEQPSDTDGNAYWPTTTASNPATGTCIEGYEESGGTPTRLCNADGTWSNTVNNECVRITCPAIPAANYNDTVTTDDDAIYPVTNAGDWNISAVTPPNQCQTSGYSAPEGYPIADCGLDGTWSNERIKCKVSVIVSCPGVTGPVMGMPLCPEGDLFYASQSGDHGCARMIEGGGCDPNNINDVMFYAGDVPGTTTDFFVRRCDLSQSYDAVDDRCEHSDTTTTTRDTYQWKNANSESATVNVVNLSVWTTTAAIDGPINTDTLVADGSGTHAAAETCNALGAGWYLPAISELDVMYANLIGTDDPDHPLPTVNNAADVTNSGTTGPLRSSFNVTGTWYWSSSERSSTRAWDQRFGNGFQYYTNKHHISLVRCARR
ncbi:MAG: hypothetical protein O2942_03585 [Proteobacteria bacterium]|nr:hypothetical protein [Pseudomonadota bacterium]